MMRYIMAFLAIGLSGMLQASVPAISIGEFVSSEMTSSSVPGLAYAAVKDGKISTVGQRGVVEKGSNIPVSPDTAFLIGSVSKTFTALGIMQLVESGKLQLDAPIAQYLNVFVDQPGGSITVRQLLGHASGFSTYQGNLSQSDFSMAADALEQRVLAVAQMHPTYNPATKWEYSNANYQILGRLIEVVSGQAYPQYIEQNILKPAGMTDSFVPDAASDDRLATGHRPWFGSKRILADTKTGLGSAPQGGVAASAEDMARYMQLMMNGEDDLISADGKALMMRPATDVSPDYGLGWFVNANKGVVFHPGSNPGYGALAAMVPAEQKAAIVLVNGGSGAGFGGTNELRYGITSKVIGLDYGGEGRQITLKLVFIALAVLPFLFVFSMAWAWRKRAVIRAKSGWFGKFSLWLPLVMTAALTWVIVSVVPRLFGALFSTIMLYQPDLGLIMAATAVMGVVWAVFRLGLAYTGRRMEYEPAP